MKQDIFEEVLGGLTFVIRWQIEGWLGPPQPSKTIYVLLSGPLAECPYVNQYVQDQVGDLTIMMDTNDE